MKIGSRPLSSGSALLIIMILTGIMGIGLASYLVLVRAQNLSVVRSQAWNSCIPVLESGVEEAMTHINVSGITNLNSAGWELNDGVYTKSRWLGDSYYTVSISRADPPVITSEGHVPVPLNTTASIGFLAGLGLEVPDGVQYARREVRVTTLQDRMWTMAMVAKGNIDLMGNNIETDSFDSENSAYSTGGQYDSTKHRANGDVATNSKIVNSLSVGNANINGRASTGPGGSIAIGPNGGIGDLQWNATHNGIQQGHTNNDMNVYFRDVSRLFSSGYTPSSGILGNTTYDYLLDGENYVMSNLSLSGGAVMMVTNQVRLLVTGNIDIKGNACIRIAKGASLELYMDGPSASIAGNGVANDNGCAIKFLYFGTPKHTSLSFSGNGTFTGAIYAPSADFTLGGGGSGTQDFVGSSVSKTVKMNGHFKFHYDEALGRANWARGYVVNSWNEI